jgi:hypothetical protein
MENYIKRKSYRMKREKPFIFKLSWVQKKDQILIFTDGGRSVLMRLGNPPPLAVVMS